MAWKGFSFKRRRWVFAPLLLFCAVFAVFFSRRPVLLIADGPFAVLYGAGRLRASSLLAALGLFRPVKLVMLSDAVGADGIALAAADRAAGPYAALFPGRYREAAELYAPQRPLTRTVVLLEPGEKRPETGVQDGENPEKGGVYYLERDIKSDLYRAGLAAAALAKNREGLVACVTGPGLGAAEEAAFALGVSSGLAGEIRYISPYGDLPPEENLAALVFFGSSERFFQLRSLCPAVLFSWIDGDAAAGNIAVIFDDSLPSLAVRAVKMAVSGGTGGIQARPRILRKNIEKGVSLGGLLKKSLPPEG
jgi:hypothetical protein